MKKLFIVFGLLLMFLWGVNKLKEATVRLQYDVFNRPVKVEVVDLPPCGRSNIIVVKYQQKNYSISVNKNDCINGKYSIGSVLEAKYNTKLDEMNPYNFLGVYRLYILFLAIVGTGLLLYILSPALCFPKTKRPR